jgi:hypothetical protein
MTSCKFSICIGNVVTNNSGCNGEYAFTDHRAQINTAGVTDDACCCDGDDPVLAMNTCSDNDCGTDWCGLVANSVSGETCTVLP